MNRVRRSLADAVDGRSALHPYPETIVRIALSPEEMAPVDREQVEAHLRQCAACRKEVELARSVDFESSAGDKGSRFERLRPLLGAAVVVIAALAYPAFLGLT